MALTLLELGYRPREIHPSVAQGLDHLPVGVVLALENQLCLHLKYPILVTRLGHLQHVLQGLRNVRLHLDQVLEVRMVFMSKQRSRYRRWRRRLAQVFRERIHMDLPQARVPRV